MTQEIQDLLKEALSKMSQSSKTANESMKELANTGSSNPELDKLSLEQFNDALKAVREACDLWYKSPERDNDILNLLGALPTDKYKMGFCLGIKKTDGTFCIILFAKNNKNNIAWASFFDARKGYIGNNFRLLMEQTLKDPNFVRSIRSGKRKSVTLQDYATTIYFEGGDLFLKKMQEVEVYPNLSTNWHTLHYGHELLPTR